MEARYLDHYSYLNSPVHRIPAHLKLAAAILLVFLVLLIPVHWETFHLLVLAVIVVTALASRLPLVQLVRRIWWMWIVVLMLALGRLWQPEEGVYLFLSTLLKSTECLMIMVLLANTTRFTELLQVLGALGVPRILLTTLSLMYRYLFVLTDERNRMQRARRARTFNTDRWQLWKTQASIISHLFLRCTERAGRIHAAMSSRGWQ